jgi:sugar lactone lactonase YvrE
MLHVIKCIVVTVLLVLVAGCGGGSGSSPARLVSISVQTSNLMVPLGGTARFTATGAYSDGSGADLTSSVTWSSSNTAVATISNSAGSKGVAAAVAGGSTVISAVFSGVSGSATVNVVPVGGASQGSPLVLTGVVATMVGSSAALNLPVGITTDGRYLYVADSTNNKIKKIEIASGVVTTVAGSGLVGSVDGVWSDARFYHPRGITTDGTYLYVAEMESNKIRRILISSGFVSTIATVDSPTGITTDGINLYVSNFSTHTISRIVISSGAVSILAGCSSGLVDGFGTAARFSNPIGITTDGTNLYVNDCGNNAIRTISLDSGSVSTLAVGFSSPATGITTDGTSLYVADYGNTVRRVTISGGAVATLLGASAGLSQPEGLTTDGKSLFVVDSLHNAILKMN